METTALYIGYAILGIIGIALFNIILSVAYLTIVCCWRIFKTRQTIRFLQKPEEQTSYDGVRAALNLLHKKGFKENLTLKEIEELTERVRKCDYASPVEQY